MFYFCKVRQVHRFREVIRVRQVHRFRAVIKAHQVRRFREVIKVHQAHRFREVIKVRQAHRFRAAIEAPEVHRAAIKVLVAVKEDLVAQKICRTLYQPLVHSVAIIRVKAHSEHQAVINPVALHLVLALVVIISIKAVQAVAPEHQAAINHQHPHIQVADLVRNISRLVSQIVNTCQRGGHKQKILFR